MILAQFCGLKLQNTNQSRRSVQVKAMHLKIKVPGTKTLEKLQSSKKSHTDLQSGVYASEYISVEANLT